MIGSFADGNVLRTIFEQGRAITNLIGNDVATVLVARWECALDVETARAILDRDSEAGIDALTLPCQEAAGASRQGD